MTWPRPKVRVSRVYKSGGSIGHLVFSLCEVSTESSIQLDSQPRHPFTRQTTLKYTHLHRTTLARFRSSQPRPAAPEPESNRDFRTPRNRQARKEEIDLSLDRFMPISSGPNLPYTTITIITRRHHYSFRNTGPDIDRRLCG